MRRERYIYGFLFLLVLIGKPNPLMGQSKFGGEFFNLFQDPRGHALGGAVVAEQNGVYSALWNPAGMAALDRIEIGVVHTSLFMSDISYNIISTGFQYSDYNVGLSVIRLGIDNIKDSRNAWLGNEIRYDQIKQFNVADYLFLFSVAPRKKNSKFWYGLNVKYNYKAYHVENASGVGIDAGILYHLSPWMTLGAEVKNALGTVILWSTGKKEWIRPELSYGLSMRFPVKSVFKVKGYLNLFNYLDNRESTSVAHIGTLSQDVAMGGAIQYKEKVQLNLGLNQTHHLTYGVSIQIPRITVTYAQLKHEELGNIHNVGVEFELPY